MSKKLQLLALINLVLLASIVISLTWKEDKASSKSEEIVLANLAIDQIDKIVINQNEIVLSNRVWQVNGRYTARPSKINTLLGILSSIEIKREISQETAQSISKETTPFSIQIYQENQPSSSFEIGTLGSEIWLKTEEGKEYFVYVPGFFFNLEDYFAVTETNWRDKRILNTSWQTLQSLSVNYTGDPSNSFKIIFDSTFYNVEGITRIDSAAVYNYIVLYEGFEIRNFITDQEIEDSLSNIIPLCTIEVNDISKKRGGRLQIYPGPQSVYGKLSEKGELVELDPRLLRTFLVNRNFFKTQ